MVGGIDSHAHLHELVDGIEEVLRRATTAGVEQIVAVGMDLGSNRQTFALAEQYPDAILPAIGYHPWRIEKETAGPNLEWIRHHLSRAAALGEIGLDYKVKVKKKLQIQVFEKLLTLAAEQDKPVLVHSRFSHKRCYGMAAAAGIKKAVFHWYSGPLDILDRILADGFLISATPALAYSPHHRAAIRHAPVERILAETDTPVSYQGIPSEPSDLSQTLQYLAKEKNLSVNRVTEITRKNARLFFGLSDS